ncbi:HIT family protein [Alcaligenes sp. SDU_A2]|uniref:HIT family protein n=1 Tax=Alcaligenes sp. SDU_A2 TaxID=3136634 RepID=UPI00311D8516
MKQAACPLCALEPDQLLWSGAGLHVLNVADSPFPGYTRVIWHEHSAEMTDLSPTQRQHLMDAVYIVEEALRAHLQPIKVNLAQFGNQVPHLHWHLIPRWRDDPFFPDSAWSPAPTRTPEQNLAWSGQHKTLLARLPAYHQDLQSVLQARLVDSHPSASS